MGQVTAASYASQIDKPGAAQKQGVAVANVGLSETAICRRHVGPVPIERMHPTLAVLRANAGLSKTPTNKPTVGLRVAEVAANAASSVNQICRPCAEQKRGAAQANAALLETAICRRLVGR